MRMLAAALLAGFALSGCSPLTTFDALIPKDAGSRQTAQGIAYGSDARQRLDVYVPDEDRARPTGRPVVVFFYGGSWNSGTRKGYDFVGRALAARGFVTIIPDYRLVPEVRYPAFVEDGAAAVRWARQHAAEYGGNPDEIVLVGHSAGAYIAAMLALDERWLGEERRAVRGFAGLAGPYDFAPFDVPASQDAFGLWPDPAETQPITWAGVGDPPTLLLTGDDDDVVKPFNSTALATQLRAAGVPVEHKRYPELGHVGLITSFARPWRGRSSALDDVTLFVKQVTASERTTD